MAANYEEILKLIVDAGESITTINQLRKRISELKKEAGDFTIGGADEAAALKKIQKLEYALRQLENRTKNANNELNETGTQVKKFGDTSAAATASLLALGYAFSDMGQFGMGFSQGIRAIANNLSSLSISMVLLQQEAKATGKSMRTLLSTAIRGPYGAIVGFQLLIGLIDLWANSQRKAKEETEKLANSLSNLRSQTESSIARIQGMKRAYDQMNPASKEAAKMKANITKELKVNISEYKNLDEAIMAHIKVLELQYESEYILGEITKKNTDNWVQTRIALKENAPILERIKELQNDLKNAEEGSQEAIAANLQIEKLRSELKPISIRQDEELVVLNERYAELQKELNKLIKGGNDEDEKKYKLKKEFFIVDKQALELMERTLKLNQLLQNAELERSALIREYINGEKTKAEKLFDEYSIVVAAIDMLNVSQSEKDRLRAQADFQYRKKLRELEEKDVKTMLDNIDKATEKASQRIRETEKMKFDAIAQLASNSFGFLIALNQALAGKTEEEQKKAFKRDKALRIAQATIDTYAAANNALATPAPPPIPQILAAAAIAAGLANVATIAGTQFNGGSSSAPSANGGGIQGGYPYPMSGFSTIDPQFPDRTGSLNIIPRTQRIVVLESDITGAQKTSIDREQKAKVG